MIIEDLPASRAAPACDELSRDLAILARSEPILYGDDRTARPFVNGLTKCPVPGDRGEKSLKSGPPACFGALMGGIRAGSGPVCPGNGELLMPQPIVRLIARRAMHVAIAAAGILVVLLVFSRQAHAATKPPASLASTGSSTTSAIAPVTSAVSTATSAASSGTGANSG